MTALRVVRTAVVWVLAAACATGLAAAQGGLAYTVQVAALSDPESAIRQSGTLLRDGFPAYVVRAEGQAGSVFRVRVGAFGDRASADRYARTMGERAGGTPRPALAEAIPAGILPLAPTVVAEVGSGARALLLPWGADGAIVRVGPEGEPARYEPMDGTTAFEAIWAGPASDAGAAGAAREEIARAALDAEATGDDPPEVREALFRQRLRLMSERSGLTEETLAGAVRGEAGSRYLVAWRGTDESGTIHGVLAHGADPADRDGDAWLGGVPPTAPEPLLVLVAGDGAAADGADVDGRAAADDGVAAADDAGGGEDDASAAAPTTPAVPVGGDGWTALTDGAWTVLRAADVSWRALVGTPRAGVDDLLVLEVGDALEIVRLVPR